MYSVAFSNRAVSTSGNGNAFALFNTTMPFAVHAITLCTDLTASGAGTRLHFNRFAPTVTMGSGGLVITPTPLVPGDVASSITAHAVDTTLATTTGANDSLLQDDWSDMTNPWFYQAPFDRMPECYLNGAIVVTFNVFGAAANLSGTILFEELS